MHVPCQNQKNNKKQQDILSDGSSVTYKSVIHTIITGYVKLFDR